LARFLRKKNLRLHVKGTKQGHRYLSKQNTPIKGIDISLRLYLHMACVQQCRPTWQPLECSWWVSQWIYCIFKALNQLWSKLSATNYLLTKYPLDMNFILHKREQIISQWISVQDLFPPMEHSERTLNSTENLYVELPNIIWNYQSYEWICNSTVANDRSVYKS